MLQAVRFSSGKNIWLSWYHSAKQPIWIYILILFLSLSFWPWISCWTEMFIHLKYKPIYSHNFFQIFFFRWKKCFLPKSTDLFFSDISAANDSCLITHSISIRSGALYFLIVLDVLVLPSSGLFMAPLQLCRLQRSRRWSSDKAYPDSPFHCCVF